MGHPVGTYSILPQRSDSSPHSHTVPCTKMSHSGWHTLQQNSLVGVLCNQNEVTHKSAEAQRLDSKSSFSHCTMHKDVSFWIVYASTKLIGGSAMQSE